MKTAVELLVQELFNNGYFHYGVPEEIVEQAKEMEKEQIVNALLIDYEFSQEEAEQYYNETYKNTDDV